MEKAVASNALVWRNEELNMANMPYCGRMETVIFGADVAGLCRTQEFRDDFNKTMIALFQRHIMEGTDISMAKDQSIQETPHRIDVFEPLG